MSERKLKNWLESYLEYTANQEPTNKLNFWVGVSVMSAAIKRQTWMQRVRYKLYPNTYVMLVAESAVARKSIAMDTGVKLLKDAVPDLYYISGSMTPEGLVKHMNRSKQILVTKEGNRKVDIVYDSHGLIHADELAETFGFDRARASKFTILLTKIYGAQDEHMHTIASEEQIVLKNLYPVFLAGTDPTNLKVLPEDAIGGLLGRLIFVIENKKKRSIAWAEDAEDVEADRLYLLLKHDLHMISQTHGQMKPTEDARLIFKTWYDKLGETKAEDRRIDAFRQRCHDTALKLAMLFSLSEGDDLIIHPRHVSKGIKHIEEQLPEFSRLTDWAASSVYAQNRARAIEMLRRQGGAGTRAQLIKQLAISMEDAIILEQSLEAEETIKISIAGRSVFYKLSKDELLK